MSAPPTQIFPPEMHQQLQRLLHKSMKQNISPARISNLQLRMQQLASEHSCNAPTAPPELAQAFFDAARGDDATKLTMALAALEDAVPGFMRSIVGMHESMDAYFASRCCSWPACRVPCCRKKCGVCGIRYCGEVCQKKDWKEHRRSAEHTAAVAVKKN
jgi:hypothetical protein